MSGYVNDSLLQAYVPQEVAHVTPGYSLGRHPQRWRTRCTIILHIYGHMDKSMTQNPEPSRFGVHSLVLP